MQIIKNKKRKGLLILSAFVLCITCLTAWWLKNAYGDQRKEQKKLQSQAFNMKLPEANAKDAGKNKLEIYMQAEKDSARLKEQQKKDSLERRLFNPGPPEEDVFADEYSPQYNQKQPSYHSRNSTTQNEQKVNDRLRKLYAAMNTPDADPETTLPDHTDLSNSKYGNNIAQLENLLSQVQNSDTGSNHEMQQLQSVLDKMLDIQYPERVKSRLLTDTNKLKRNIYTVSTSTNSRFNNFLNDTSDENDFWGLELEEDPFAEVTKRLTTVLAVVHRDQVVQDNSTIMLRLLQDVYINDILIPKGELISGTCELSNDRVKVHIPNVTYNNVIYPVSLMVYDIDGLEGIKVLGGSGHDATKDELNQAIQNMQLSSMNPSIATQAAATGVGTIKTLLTKNKKNAKANVKANHNLLLQMKKIN